jgi:hypothetical protein
MFDPNKHRKTAARLAELKTKAPQQWEIRKPKPGDFIQIYGDTIEELDIVTMFEQRNGAGKEQEWLIQGKDEKEEDKIIGYLNHKHIKSAIVAPVVIAANRLNYIWLAKQGNPFGERVYDVHLQIKDIIKTAQQGWTKAYYDNDSKQYVMEPPELAIELGDPVWPSKDEILDHLKKSFAERMIETVDHEIVKRTRGLIR